MCTACGPPVSGRAARVHHRAGREELIASVIGSDGAAMYKMPFYDARTAVTWAEKVRLVRHQRAPGLQT